MLEFFSLYKDERKGKSAISDCPVFYHFLSEVSLKSNIDFSII